MAIILIVKGRRDWTESSGLERTVRTTSFVKIRLGANIRNRDYDFGLPSFPWVNGRDFAGIVVKTGNAASRIKAGDVVRLIS